MIDKQSDVAIIGAGIVGLAVGLQLTRKHPDLKVVVLEKEREIACHQTGHNSGVLHSGLYYKPGSLKARLCVEGRAAMVEFCKEHGIPFELCGKIVVATDESELPGLKELLHRGAANGVSGLRELNADEIRGIEPYASGIRGIHVPFTGITDFKLVSAKFSELIRQNGGEVLTGHGIHKINPMADGVILETASGTVSASYVINCAGLQSDLIAMIAGAKLGLRIIPFRGEYYEVAPAKQHLVKGLIYPVADPRFPFLGVHFTRRIQGGVEAGPNAVLSFKREGYLRTSFNIADMLTTASFPGFWKMAGRNWSSGIEEMYRSWNKRAFTRALQRLIPDIQEDDLQAGGSGVRAQAVDSSGKLLDDFCFLYQDRILHVCNVPSPAATASVAIGREIVTTLEATVPFRKIRTGKG